VTGDGFQSLDVLVQLEEPPVEGAGGVVRITARDAGIP
jgi:hypothetical protein